MQNAGTQFWKWKGISLIFDDIEKIGPSNLFLNLIFRHRHANEKEHSHVALKTTGMMYIISTDLSLNYIMYCGDQLVYPCAGVVVHIQHSCGSIWRDEENTEQICC